LTVNAFAFSCAEKDKVGNHYCVIRTILALLHGIFSLLRDIAIHRNFADTDIITQV